MTEAEWERGIKLHPMLGFLHEHASERKLRLFAVACCRRQWELFPHVPHRQLINAAERLADGIGTLAELRVLGKSMWQTQSASKLNYQEQSIAAAAANLAGRAGEPLWMSTLWVAEALGDAVSRRVHAYHPEFHEYQDPEEYHQITLLHDIVGNPFLPECIDPVWLTPTVLEMAERVYETSDFTLMPILADALQDADCDNPGILDHCRGPGPHVRGCWVVDLILGKE